ncbi:MAG: DUF1846 domain-containing protein [Ruminococcaceae bacterium]|nr:DUF1846 domain-containing protein [Oscillospiraceae bacterium]MBQ8896994.1 DUF1846 domain-containing protein [Clostridia bacterium]
MKIGFDNDLYIKLQTEHIRERISRFGNKLYLEFGGKLFDDYHAARVLPGFDLNGKVKLLLNMKEDAELIMCVSAEAIEKNKIRADMGITYDEDAIRLVILLSGLGIKINSVVITLYDDQPAAAKFKTRLENMGITAYIHRPTKGYPTDVETIISEEGYGANPYIETTRPLVVITAPGPGCGKLATALSQLYHDNKRGLKAGYAKFETFPIWNIPLKHPVNLAYEAATADLNDVNMIDPYHLEAYGVTTVNYNRDIEVFPVVRTILERITGTDIYKSPTDMGVNMAGFAICDDEVCREASKQEIIRRYYKAACDKKLGSPEADVTVGRIQVIMQQAGTRTENRLTALAARARTQETGVPATAIELADGRFAVGRMSDLLTAPASAMLNAIKMCAGMADPVHLLAPRVLEPILKMKKSVLKSAYPRLNVEEVLIAMSICADLNPSVELAMNKLGELAGCEAHSTVMLTPSDIAAYRKLGINLSCDPEFLSKFDT